MPWTNEDHLPSYEELTVPELEITSSVFRAVSHHMGYYCDAPSKEFMLCRAEDQDPRKCIQEGKEVTRCGFEFLRKLKKTCLAEFNQYHRCIDHSGREMYFYNCRNTQKVYDDCVKEHFGQDRPETGYFTKVRVVDAKRPKSALVPHPNLPEKLPPAPDFSKETEREKSEAGLGGVDSNIKQFKYIKDYLKQT